MIGRRDTLVALAGAALGVVASPASTARGDGLRFIRRSALAFGTTVSLTFIETVRADIEAAFVDGFAAIRAIERAANLHDPLSEITRLNRNGRIGSPSPILTTLVRFALDLAAASGGSFDPTVQPIWLAWSDAARRGHLADPATLAQAVALVGWRQVACGDEEIRFTRPGMQMTLNAIAQGYATDLVMAAATRHGVDNAFLDTGELGAAGTGPAGRPWRVELAHPRRPDGSMGDLALADRRFMSTSGDWECCWTPDFSEHHIVEPWSGHSPARYAETAVVAASGLIADGLSTALMVAPPSRQPALLALDASAGAVLVDKSCRLEAIGAATGLASHAL